MKLEQIKAKYSKLKEKLKLAEARIKVIKVHITALQSLCEHPNIERWQHYDYGGGCDNCESCPDCGYSKY